MIERAIENWLINTNERNYQVPFCQVLIQKGHKVIYISSHRPMEQGKDIITIDRTGECCAYQLKTGDINLATWRKILGEIKELIELPVVHSSVDKNKPHKSFLVTNGEIQDEVRIQIDQINEDNKTKERGYSYLDVINGPTLLKEFLEAQGQFYPKELKDFDLFLRLFLTDGCDFLAKDKFFNFLNNIIFNVTSNRKSNVSNAISSSIIITAYSLNPYQIKNNYYALFEAWTSLAASIVRYAKKTGLDEINWRDSFNLALSEAVRNLNLLKEETTERKDFLEGSWLGDGGLIYRARATIVLGALTTLELHTQKNNKKYVQDKELLQLIINNLNTLWFWGDSAFPFFFSIIKFLELNQENSASNYLLKSLFVEIVNCNSRKQKTGLPNPYFNVDDILEAGFGIKKEGIDYRQFSGSSSTLEPMIWMIVRRNERSLLQDNWRELSYIRMKEFIPDKVEDLFAWRTDEGMDHSAFIKPTQSWSMLTQDCENLSELPSLYFEYVHLLRFFILVCPHRMNKQIFSLLDEN